MKITDAQQRALNKLRDHGGWMLLRDLDGCLWRTINALVKRGLVERHTVAGLSEYKAKPHED
jgi:hypothetical protein